MNDDRSGLPEFGKPPVVEVALSIRFKPLSLTTGHVGLLWDRFRSDFPQYEDQPPFDVPIEIEHERVPTQVQPQLRLMSKPRLRSWFISAPGTQLIQVQHDLLAHNWRRNDTDETYPRFRAVMESFEKELKVFASFLRDYDLGTLEPIQCEVTYINHIVAGPTWSTHDQLGRVFTVWSAPTHAFLPPADDGRFLVRYVIPDKNGKFCGRLHVSVQPAFSMADKDEKPLFATSLTARGGPLGDGLSGALEFLETGHVWIVRGFADITTPEMHAEWRRV